jgi:hypothetical protein
VELRIPSTRGSTKVCSRNISTHVRVRLWEDIPSASGSLLVYNTLCSSKPLGRSYPISESDARRYTSAYATTLGTILKPRTSSHRPSSTYTLQTGLPLFLTTLLLSPLSAPSHSIKLSALLHLSPFPLISRCSTHVTSTAPHVNSMHNTGMKSIMENSKGVKAVGK